MPEQRPSVGVVGVGTVGSAVQRWFERQGSAVALYDPAKGFGDAGSLRNADIVFVCVPTPYVNGAYDGSHLADALAVIPQEKTVVIKSTVLPGTTEELQRRQPAHRLLFSPEFLREKTVDEDFVSPDRQIVGYTERSRQEAEQLLAVLPRAPYERVLPATEAELIKHATNAMLAVRVVFANELYDLCDRLGVDYELVKEGLGADPRIGPSHLDVMKDGYRGYSGKCLPKDAKGLVSLAKELGVDLRLLETADAVNERLRAREEITAV